MAERRYPHPVARDGIAETIADIAEDAQRLVQLEIELAKQEIGGLVKRNAIAIGMMAGAALCALFAVYTLVSLIVVGLVAIFGDHEQGWAALSSGIVLLLWSAAAAVLGLMGKSRIKISGPEATIKSLKEDVEWVKAQIRPATK